MSKTIEDLFKAVGYDYHNMEPNVFYPAKKHVKIASVDTHTNEKFYDDVVSVVYKGMSKGYNVIVDGTVKFKCTKQHKFYNSLTEKFEAAENLFPHFTGVNNLNNNIEITLEEDDEEFPVLDMEIANNHTYLSNGILSHNTFGGTANVLSSGLKMINPYLAKYNTSLIFVNQERALIGGFSPVPGATSTPGGFARKFYASSRNRITRIETIKDHGDPVGIKMKFRNVKSKVGIPFREAIVDLYFASGIDSEGEYLDFILKLLCERKGAWYNNEDWGMHVQGANGVMEFLNQNPEIYAKAKETVNDMLCGRTILDEDKSNISEDVLEEMTPEEKAWADYKKEDDDDFVEV